MNHLPSMRVSRRPPESSSKWTGVSISWFGDHRRSNEIADVVGVRPFFLRGRSRILPVRYANQFLSTWSLLRAERPSLIVVMQPPVLAILAVLPYVKRHDAMLVGDLHSGTFFDRKWRWASKWVLLRLKAHGMAIVPNEDLAEMCRRAGVEVFVCHGLLPQPSQGQDSRTTSREAPESPYALVPFTYAADEPVDELLEAARQLPGVSWVLTGDAPSSVRGAAPANVRFTGFVSKEEYTSLRRNAHVILALTTRESTMQSAGYEALAGGTPLITSNTRVLRGHFKDGARYVEPTAPSIADGVNEVMNDIVQFRRSIAQRGAEVLIEQDAVRELIRARLAELMSSRAGARARA